MSQVKLYFYGAFFIGMLSLIWYIQHLQDSRESYKVKAAYEEAEKVKATQTINNLMRDAEKDRKLLEQYQNTKREIQYVDKIVTKQVIKYRDIVTTRFVIPPEFVLAYNNSTESVHTANSTTRINESTSTITKIVNDADLLEVVTSNNRICVKQAAQLSALQVWVQP